MASTNGCINLNTPSDESAKQYDAILTQICGWYEDQSTGGLAKARKAMLEADPEFVLGVALDLELNLMGALSSPRFDQQLAERIEALNKLVERKRDQVNDQELLHVQVVNHWAKSELKEATRKLEKIATLYPEDVSALKMNQDTYFMLGTALPMRNSLAASLGQISDKNPLKGYVHGMYSFALEESNMFDEAQVEAKKALDMIPRDTWAIHNYAHCLEMQAKVEEGLKWMYEKKCDWSPCQMLACHQYWHSALFHINNDQFDDAVALLDKEVLTRCVKGSTSLDMHDAASMVYRMELVDLFGRASEKSNSKVESHKRWQSVYNMCEPHKRDHLLGFNDAHFMMSYLGMDDLQAARELIDTIDISGHLNEGQTVVKPLLEAMYQFKLGAYGRCVDLLENIRFDIIRIGGSHAQRDIFEQLLLVAALKSDKVEHNKLGQRMLLERETFHGRKVKQTQLLAEAA